MGDHNPTGEGAKEGINRRMFIQGVAGALGVGAIGTKVTAQGERINHGDNSNSVDGSRDGNAPQLEQYDVIEYGARSPHIDIKVDWEVSDPDGDLSSVLIQVLDDGNRIMDATRENLKGRTARNLNYLRINDVDDQSFEVRIGVTDEQGNTVSDSSTVTE